MAPESNAQTFSFETVAALMAALFEKGGNIGNKEYEAMASMDGSRSASAFEHQFRKVKARAKELLEANGGTPTPSTPARKADNKSEKATPASNSVKGTGKRARKAKKSDNVDADDNESPTKKIKTEPSEQGSVSDEEEGGTKL